MSPRRAFVSLWRTFSKMRAHCFVASGVVSFRICARCVTEPMAKFSCKMSVVAKAAGVGNLAERLARIERRPAKQKGRGMIQANGIHQSSRAPQKASGRSVVRSQFRLPPLEGQNPDRQSDL